MNKSKVNPLLKDGMVVYSTKDPRGNRGDWCYYVYHKQRIHEGSRALCFGKDVPFFEALGFEVGPHWITANNIRGEYAVTGLEFHSGKKEIDPIADLILRSERLSNESFKTLLSQENE